ncbi:MAG: NAD+ synthase [Egibacteraceae bacterium]
MRIAMAQLNPTVGDLPGNRAALSQAYERAVEAGADLVVSGELGLTGYPPEDLVLKPAFVAATATELGRLAEAVGPVPLVVGVVEDLAGHDDLAVAEDTVMSEDETARTLANSAAVLRDGAVEAHYRKQRIPNYGVFDEARYFQAGTGPLLVDAGGLRVGVTVCEDLWGEGGPLADSAAEGAQLLLSLNASPYERDKREQRERWARHHARGGRAWLAYCNLVGGQDEVVFDGDSFLMAPDGTVVARGAHFAEDLVVADLDVDAGAAEEAPLGAVGEAYEALVLGVRDYLGKNGFDGAILGVSGGIDSALTAAVAVDALGPEAVTCVAMPSPWSSEGSLTDAEALATTLGARYEVVAITPMMEAFDTALAPLLAGAERDITEENLQSRIRGAIVMALSNKWGDLVLATGNKSEYAVGYATLYGDMAGGLAVLKDVDKTLVYKLARYRNTTHRAHWQGPTGAVIPEATITKPPSAELRPDQRDTDSLPPYEVLDPILAGYIERRQSVEELVAAGFDPDLVAQVARLVDRAEYKRRQAAPGIKVTHRAFGRDRRLPMTQRWWG